MDTLYMGLTNFSIIAVISGDKENDFGLGIGAFIHC